MKSKYIFSILCIHLMVFLFAQNKELNIKQFNVNGSDKVDDTQNFDKAIEYITQKGGILYIPKGNYYLDNTKRTRPGVYNNAYIFVINNSFKIKMDKEAVLHYKNDFKGFRFRSTQDPTDKTVNKYEVEIEGGNIEGTLNNEAIVKDNPNKWAFLAEAIKKFKVTGLIIKNLYCSAGISSYSNDYTEISGNTLENITGNPSDYADNHGDGIYVANTKQYNVSNNQVVNNINVTDRIGRVGICIEYEKSNDGNISNNKITGYDRGVHIELIRGSATIYNNVLEGNCSGIVLWNNNGFKQIIDSNIITNSGMNSKQKSLLYTSAPILLLGLNTNRGTDIKNNKISILKEFYLPNNILQITSDNVSVLNNTFYDNTKTLSLSISQGDGEKKRVKNIIFNGNKVLGANVLVYDGSEISISNNELDVNQVTLSFDQSNNVYRNNTLKNQKSKNAVTILGRYSN